MTLQGVDYSYGPLPAATAKANGLSFVCRYVSTPGNGKNLTTAEVADFSTNGVGIVVVFETAANNPLSGNAQGVTDAQGADAQVTVLGLAGCPVYFAVDFQATTAQLATIGAYLQGAASVIGLPRVGVYGDYSVVNYALNNTLATYAWQTYAWSAGQLDARSHIYQYQNGGTVAGVSVDFDRTISSDSNYGQAAPALPVVTGVNPASGQPGGGDTVVVAGSRFTGATAVSFGTVAATNLTVASDTQLSVTSPAANASGAVDVTVTTPVGTSATSAADQFTYLAGAALPVVTAVNPASGAAAGGDTVVVSGSGFTGATDVSFGTVAATNVTVASDTQLSVTSPPANASGAVDVTVATPAGTSNPSPPADQFTYLTAAALPVVTGVNPASGAAAGGDTVVVSGSGFTGATAVSFGTVAATNLTVASDTQLSVTSPAANASGAVDVTVDHSRRHLSHRRRRPIHLHVASHQPALVAAQLREFSA